MVRIWIASALFGCGMILSLVGWIAGKRQCKEPMDWIKLGRSAGLTAGGAIATASAWPIESWAWSFEQATGVLLMGFGINVGLTKGYQAAFPQGILSLLARERVK